MSSNIEELKKMAKFHKYFWNGLFVALYEPHRKRYPVVSLAVSGGKNFIPMSESAIKNYLACKTRMDYDTFLVFCHGIKIDIEKKRILELMPYIERAGACLDEMAFSGKVSRSKTKRQQAFSQADALSDEGHLWEKQLVQDAAPEMLCGKLEKADFYFQPEDAQSLLKYRNAEPETWQTLNAFHQLIFSYPEENIEGQTFTEQESLLIFLYWLISVPSLCR